MIPAWGLGCGSAAGFFGFGAGAGGTSAAAAAGSAGGSFSDVAVAAEESGEEEEEEEEEGEGEEVEASLGAGTSVFAEGVAPASGVVSGVAAKGEFAEEESGAACGAGVAGCAGAGVGGALVSFVLLADGETFVVALGSAACSAAAGLLLDPSSPFQRM